MRDDLSESRRPALFAPVVRQTRIGHQLVRGEAVGLPAGEDGRNDVRGKIGQSQKTGRERRDYVLAPGDVLDGRSGALAHALVEGLSPGESRTRLWSGGEDSDAPSMINFRSFPVRLS